MGEKKGKALARKLVDELLNDADGTGAQPLEMDVVEDKGSSPALTFANDKTVSNSDSPKADETERIHATRAKASDPAPERASVGRFGTFQRTGPATATDAALAQSENLRIAQNRLLELEQEIERLRQENQKLARAGETYRRLSDELQGETQKRESDYKHAISMFEQEKGILNGTKEALQRDLEVQRRKNEELDLRISSNIQKIRVRERELENRLELVKMESAALIRSKDEMILELKRNIDQTNLELKNYHAKNKELNRLANDKQEMLRRTVKALRLALSMLEGEEEPAPAAKRKP